MKPLRCLRGRLLYRRRSSGEERGREDWQLSHNPDGSRTLRCLARTDDSGFLRDAVYTVDANGLPQEVYVRLMVGERHIGSGYFRTALAADGGPGPNLRITVDRPGEEEVRQLLAVPPRFHIMTHAVMLDGWSFWCHDPDRDGEQEVTVYNTSTRWDGTDGPLGRLEPLRVLYEGEEEVEVPAGTFLARRYRLISDRIGSPPCHLWVHGPDLLLLRYDWPDLDLEYVLGEIDDG